MKNCACKDSMGQVGQWHTCVLNHFSCVQLFLSLWTVAHQAPLSKEFSRQEYWSGLPFPSPGDLPNPGIKPVTLVSPALQAYSLPSEPPEKALGKSISYILL